MKKIALVGAPNVGKSVLFNALVNSYRAVVSNYPGTTVEVTRGKANIKCEIYEVIDTPGMYSFSSITEEEKVGRDILLKEHFRCVIHVIDAKNILRMLPLTLQLLEAGFPVIVVLNMIDEALEEGITIDVDLFEQRLGVRIFLISALKKEGLELLKNEISEYSSGQEHPTLCHYQEGIEKNIEIICKKLTKNYPITKRAIASLLLKEDKEITDLVKHNESAHWQEIEAMIQRVEQDFFHHIEYEMAISLRNSIEAITHGVFEHKENKNNFKEKLSRWMMQPLTGLPILFVVLYFAFYKFVSGFGAGVVVDFLDKIVFDKYVNPFFVNLTHLYIKGEAFQSLFVGDYGIITMGLKYALAIILPIVSFFFLVFSIIEDSGYLPRLAMLLDRVFKKIGLSGRAVIPMVLGFGCATMATMVTRILPTKKEKIIATILLALAVPCSAQLGVLLSVLDGNTIILSIWICIILLVFLLVGYCSSKILKGEGAFFYMEIPPLRLPKLSHIFIKTYVRIKWYLKEVIPLFVLSSVFVWALERLGLFKHIISILSKPVSLLGLPVETASIFFFGFFRRDYGAAGLYDLHNHSVLTDVQLLVATVALTLFLPCIAQFFMNIKERGWKIGFIISGFTLIMSFCVAYIVKVVANYALFIMRI